jgi:hypothetical protein
VGLGPTSKENPHNSISKKPRGSEWWPEAQRFPSIPDLRGLSRPGWGRADLDHISDFCFFGTMSGVDFILPV